MLRAEIPDLRLRLSVEGNPHEALAEDEVLWTPTGPCAARLRPVSLPENEAWLPSRDGHYAVTGAFGALGEHVVRWLAQRGARSIEGIGRRGGDRPADLPTEVAVTATALDVADPGAVSAWAAARPKVDGVFHLAGTLRDGLAVQMSREDLEDSVRPKATGAEVLLDALGEREEFAFLCAFSSAAAVLGNPGQAAYAAANGALPTHPKVLRYAFGPWQGPGMAEGPDQRQWERRGVQALAPDKALDALGRLLLARLPQAMILDVDWTRLAASLPAGKELPSLLTGVVALPRGQTGSSPGGDSLQVALPEELAALLGRDLRPVDRERTLPELGIDSLMTVDLCHRVNQRTGLNLPMEFLLTGATVAALLKTAPPTRDARAAEALLAEVEGLSEEEARRLLDGEDGGVSPEDGD